MENVKIASYEEAIQILTEHIDFCESVEDDIDAVFLTATISSQVFNRLPEPIKYYYYITYDVVQEGGSDVGV